ncbi:unnamed protein product [Caenorhabditis nigoni]
MILAYLVILILIIPSFLFSTEMPLPLITVSCTADEVPAAVVLPFLTSVVVVHRSFFAPPQNLKSQFYEIWS